MTRPSARSRRFSNILRIIQIRKLCARGQKCGLAPDGQCTRLAGCPVFPVQETIPTRQGEELHRRTMVLGGAIAGVVGVVAALVGGFTAIIGRAVGHTPTPQAGPATGSRSTSPQGTAVAAASSVPVGRGVSFTAPDGKPAWVVHPSGNTFVAFSAICTHNGCTVQFEPSAIKFICPCHGGVFDGRNGQVLQGPPPAPLPTVAVKVVNGQILAT